MNVMEKVKELAVDPYITVFIGPESSGFTLKGVKYNYLSYVNGYKKQEGESGNFVGSDINEDDLVEFSAHELIKEAGRFNAKSIVFRAKCLGDKIEHQGAYLDDKGKYHPAGVSLRTRVAFIGE